MKIAAAGGGTERDSVPVDKYFAEWITGGGTLLYLPIALGWLPVYGGSAGAAILGRYIDTVRHLDENEVEITDTTGLDLLSGISVWVHYRQTEKEMVEGFVSGSSGSVVVMSERAAVAFDGTELKSAGFEPAYLVDGTGWKVVVR